MGATWEELWARWVEELKDLERKARREMGEEAPSFERLRFFCTAPGTTGEPWLRLPQTFSLDDPLECFQTDILPKQRRVLDRACWGLALKKSPLGLGTDEPGNPRTDSVPKPKVGEQKEPVNPSPTRRSKDRWITVPGAPKPISTFAGILSLGEVAKQSGDRHACSPMCGSACVHVHVPG